MFMILLLLSCHLVILGTIALTFRLYAKPTKNVLLETTFTDQQLATPQVHQVVGAYRRQLNYFCLALALLGLPILFIRYDSLLILYFFFLLLVTFAGAQYILMTNIRNMQLLKTQEDWRSATESSGLIRIDTDLSLSKNQRLVSPYWLLPPAVIALGLTLLGAIQPENWHLSGLLNGCFLLSLLLLGWSYWAIYRLPAKVLTADPEINRYCNDLAKSSWSLTVVLTAYFLTAIHLLLFLTGVLSPTLLLISTLLVVTLSLVLSGLSVYLLLDSRKKQNEALAHTHQYANSEDDYFWRYGFYLNPQDSRLLVQDRIGLNLALNFGHRSSKLIISLVGLVLAVLMIGLSTMMLKADFATNAFAVDFTQDELRLKAPFAPETTLAYEQITEATLLDQLPPAIRVGGASTSNYATGRFSVTGDDSPALFYVNKGSEKFIKIVTKSTDYYISNPTTKETLATFDALQAKRK